MCRKVIQTYQQTFNNSVPNTNKQTFYFQRIYKTKPEQYFKLKLTTLLAPNPTTFTGINGTKNPTSTNTPFYTDTANPTKITSETMVMNSGEYSTQILTSSLMNEVFLSGIDELRGRCNYMKCASTTSVIQKNDFYLGNLYDVGLRVPPEIILREIPLDPFTIYVNGNNTQFIVSFLIELLED
jgi:hypothetical protein